MSQTYVHLLMAHLPAYASAFGFLILVFGLWRKSNNTKIAGFFLMIVASVGAGISYLTGESAEHTVEDMAGISGNAIEQHEEFAKNGLIGLIVLGIIALVGLILTLKRKTMANAFAYLTLAVAVIGFYLVAKTANLGGKIRHTEISNAGQPANSLNESEEEHE